MNNEVISQLPQKSNNKAVFAALSRADGKTVFKFMVMPSEMNYDISVNYASAKTVGLVSPALHYSDTDNTSLSIQNLPIGGRGLGLDITKYVDALATFTQPTEKGKAPPVLLFVWGQRSHSPCLMTKLTKTERDWYPNGQLAECSLAFTLIKVGVEQLIQA